jgi:hypothetical protein
MALVLRLRPRQLCAFAIPAILAAALAMLRPSASPRVLPPSPEAANLIVAKVTDMGPVPQSPEIRGRDGGYSFLFGGHVVWSFGDTFLHHRNAEHRGLLSDSWSFTEDRNAMDGLAGFHERLDSAGAPTMLYPETPAETSFNAEHDGNHCHVKPCGARFALWPAAIVADPDRHRALLFYSLVSARPGEFHSIGSSVAIWENFADRPIRPAVDPPVVPDHPELLFKQEERPFGAAALMKNGMLYAYGCEAPGLAKPCKLGRVSPADVLDRRAWSFYAGSGKWTSELSDAADVFDGQDIMSVSYNDFLEQYVAIYSRVLSQDVVIRTAPSPEGPWSEEVRAFTVFPPKDGGNVYDALAHPEYNVDGGRIMFVTYTRGTGPLASEMRLFSVEFKPR